MTEYTNHERPVRVTNLRKNQAENVIRADSAMFGRADFKQNALQIILENTRHSPTRDLHKAYSTGTENVLDAVLNQYAG